MTTTAPATRERLGRETDDETGQASIAHSVELWRTSEGLELELARGGRLAGSTAFPPPLHHRIVDRSAAALERQFDSFCLDLARGAAADLETANHLARLVHQMMRKASADARIANISSQVGSDDDEWFDVCIFQWGASDYEVTLRARSRSESRGDTLGKIDVLRSGRTLDEAHGAALNHLAVLTRALGQDSESSARLEELRDACRRAHDEAMRTLAR